MRTSLSGLTGPVVTLTLPIFFLLFALPAKTTAQDLSFLSDTTHYLWPTDASPYISSTFGETRAAHFHAGLDIRTWGQEGYRVFATRDGIISRISTGPTGYGKVIYLRHRDNSYSVYAHLNRFEDQLMAFVDSIRMENGSALLDIDLESRRMAVRQGDLIAYTGSTGAGPPHLHFELRTPENEPFNPLLTNLDIDDTIPPVFTGLGVEHLDPHSLHVNERETIRPRRDGNRYQFGTVKASGPVGLSVNVHDRANRTTNVYAVYRLSLVHEQDTLFYSQVDTYNYRDARQMFIDRVFPLLRERRQGFQRLYTVNGNTLPFYQTDQNRGVLNFPEGTWHLSIIAEDYHGNRSVAGVTLEVESPEAGRQVQQIASIPAYPRIEAPAGIDVYPTVTRFNPVAVETHFLTHLATPGPNPESDPAPQYLAPWRLDSVASNRSRRELIPGRRQLLHLPDQTVWVDFPNDALFDTLQVEMQVEYRDSLPTITFNPSPVPLKGSVWLNVIVPATADSARHVGLYAHNERTNRYSYLGGGEHGTILRTRINELQRLQLRYDETPPAAGTPTIQRDLAGNRIVTVRVTDSLSGIDYARSAIRVNGLDGLTEYDPDKRQLIFYRPGFEPQSVNQVDVRVYDRAGNLTHKRFDQVSR